MVDMQQFEELLQAVENEIDELSEGSIKNNLIDIHGALYCVFEEVQLVDFDQITEENTVMKEYLADRLTYEEKQHFKIKHGIEVGVGYGLTL